MTKHHVTWLRIKQNVWEQVCQEAHKRNRSYSNMIGTMIKDYLKKVNNGKTD